MGTFYNTNTVRDGLILHLDAANKKSYTGSGLTVNDLINKNNGTLVNGPVFSGGTFSFDGADDYISVSSSSRFLSWAPVGTTGNKIMTFEMWLKTADTTGQAFSKPWNGSGNYNYRFTPNAFVTQVNTAHSLTFPSIADNTWKHITAIVNETQKAVYINGELVAGFVNHGETSDTPFSGESSIPLSIMTMYPYGEGSPNWPQVTHALQGDMSSFKIYNRQLSYTEINQNFNALRGRYGV